MDDTARTDDVEDVAEQAEVPADTVDASQAAEGNGQEPAARVKPRRSFSERAQGDLNRARKSLGRDWTKTDERFDFYLAEANVLAMLDLADAIRSSQNR